MFQRNIVKEYLQTLVLDFIYSHQPYGDLIFYGGSCLKHLFALPRLSEDLDFVDLKKDMNLEKLAKELTVFFVNQFGLKVSFKIQKFRIYLKFPLLHELELSTKSETDWLFLKIEICSEFGFAKNYQIEVRPVFKYNRSILIKTFDLPTLMATKLRAILYRQWEKTDRKGTIFLTVKGRDYFDLMWYLERGVKPNLACLKEVKNQLELKERLLELVAKVDQPSIQLDLEALIENEGFVKNLGENVKEILMREIRKKM